MAQDLPIRLTINMRPFEFEHELKEESYSLAKSFHRKINIDWLANN